MPFWQEAFWKSEQVKFPAPEVDCEAVFARRLGLSSIESEVGADGATTIPAEEMARKWQTVWQEVEGGKTVAITSGGRPVARIVPIPDSEEEEAMKDPLSLLERTSHHR